MIFITVESNICQIGTSTKIILAGITINDENGNRDAITANDVCEFDYILSAMKKGIIISIIKGQTPDCASCGLSKIAPTVAYNDT